MRYRGPITPQPNPLPTGEGVRRICGSRINSVRSNAGIAIALVTLFLMSPAQAQLRGHGGPVRALAISPDGTTAVSGSFDTSAIRWSLARNAAEQVLRFHESAVNAIAFAADGRIVTGGEDGK